MLSDPQTKDPIIVTVHDSADQKPDGNTFVISDVFNEDKERERVQLSQIVD